MHGAVQSIGSNVTFSGMVYFERNFAYYVGGAMMFEGISKLILMQVCVLELKNSLQVKLCKCQWWCPLFCRFSVFIGINIANRMFYHH